MQCSVFPFRYEDRRYLADRTFSGEVAAYVQQVDACRHVNDTSGTPRIRLESLLNSLEPGLVVFVAEDPSLGAHMKGCAGKPIPEEWQGLRRAEAYLHASRYVRVCKVLSGKGPDATVSVESQEEVEGRVLLHLARPGDMVLFAREDISEETSDPQAGDPRISQTRRATIQPRPRSRVIAEGMAEPAFSEGMRSADVDTARACPYPEGSPRRHWWTRGFSYQARLLRALTAEKDRDELRARLRQTEEKLEVAAEGIRRYRRVQCPELRFIDHTEVAARLDVDEWEKDHAREFPQEGPCPT